jgi:hypothetical protein
MKYIILFLFFPAHLFSQESKLKLLGAVKINDSLVLQTCELTIFNSSFHSICIKVSPSFETKILSRDTIQLASFDKGNGCFRYDLWISKDDENRGFNDFPRYPLILFSRAAFVTTIKVIRNLRCKDSWIEFSFLNQAEIDYCEIMNKHNKGKRWDIDPKLKYRNRKIYLDKTGIQ